MNISFIENMTIIDRERHMPLGKLTCDMLNDHSWDQQRLLEGQLWFLQPMGDEKATDFIIGLENTMKEFRKVQERIKKYSYYDLNDEAANTFAAIEALLASSDGKISDIRWGTLYLRDIADSEAVTAIVRARLGENIPLVTVKAPVCRPAWLVELECVAVNGAGNEQFPVLR